MPRKKSYFTVTDQFCGGGGSGQGIKKALDKVGGEIVLGLNHWKLATETYSTNFPTTQVDCADISNSDPRRYPSSDGLCTSPECRPHTPAGGNYHKKHKQQMELFQSGKVNPSTERSRATMWDVVRFTEYHNYNIIIVENVVEAKTQWVLFDDWLRSMHTLGYKHKCVYLNSMHFHPTPQSRDRMYIVFWKKNNKAPDLNFYPEAFCYKCEKNILSVQSWKNKNIHFGKYKLQYEYCCPDCSSVVEPYYYASFNCIDWSDIGNKISEREKPLAEKTIKRAEYGLEKYSHSFIINDQPSTGINFRVKGVDQPLPVIPCTHQLKFVCPPFIIKGEHSQTDPLIKTVFQSLQTQLTRQTMSLVTPPFLIEMYGQSTTRTVIQPINAQTTREKNALITTDSWNSFIASYYGGSNCTKHITEVLGTQTTKERSGLFTFQKPSIEDCYFRMLKPVEIKLAMGFNKDHVLLGSGKNQVRLCGAAVTPPVMEALWDRAIASLN